MRRLRIRLWGLMLLVAVAAVLAWVVRHPDGRLALIFSALVLGGLAAGFALCDGIDRAVDRIARRHRRD